MKRENGRGEDPKDESEYEREKRGRITKQSG